MRLSEKMPSQKLKVGSKFIYKWIDNETLLVAEAIHKYPYGMLCQLYRAKNKKDGSIEIENLCLRLSSKYKEVFVMSKLYISDLHLGHKNAIVHDNRPFADLDEMHSSIIANWNNVVKEEDEVYILGDFAWKNQSLIRYFHSLKDISSLFEAITTK